MIKQIKLTTVVETNAGATNHLFCSLPPGSRLRSVSAGNLTTGWNRVSLQLQSISNPAIDSAALISTLPLKTEVENGGYPVTWYGDLNVGEELRKARAEFGGLAGGDTIYLLVGIEE